AGKTGDEEGGAPAVLRSDSASQEEPECASHRDRDVKKREHASTLFPREKIADQGGGHRRKAGFADSNERPRDQQPRIRSGQTGKSCGPAPEHDPRRDKVPPLPTITENARDRRRHDVRQHEYGEDTPDLKVRQVELALDQRRNRGDDVAIDVVEEVDAEENRRGKGAAAGERHPVCDCTMATTQCPLRAALIKNPFSRFTLLTEGGRDLPVIL